MTIHDDKVKEYAEILGHRVNMLRITNKMTQQELADKLGCKQNAISKVESGQNMATTKMIIQLCDLFGVEFSFFDPTSDLFEQYRAKKT